MSNNYERNTTMVLCILGVLVIGSIAVGAITFFGATTWGPGDLTPVYFHEDRNVGGVTGLVTIDVDINTGSLNLLFEDNDTLLYRVDVEMTNGSFLQYGEPTIDFSSNTLTVSHEVAAFNITLGNAVNYTIDAVTTTGSIVCLLAYDAMIGDIDLTTGTGSITFTMTGAVSLRGNPDFSLKTETGSIIAVVVLPGGVGGEFEASTSLGSITINAPTWDERTSSHYRTDDYGEAAQNLDIIAQTGTGSITATLT